MLGAEATSDAFYETAGAIAVCGLFAAKPIDHKMVSPAPGIAVGFQ
jgi:hypothetical protein